MQEIQIDRAPRTTLIFKKPEDVTAFLDNEEKFWTFLQSAKQSRWGSINEAVARYQTNWTSGVRAAADRWSAGDPSAIEDIRQQLHRRFSDQGRLSARDPQAIGLAGVSAVNVELAPIALTVIDSAQLLFTDQNFMNFAENRMGIAHGFAVLAGMNPNIAVAATATLDASLASAQDEIAKARAERKAQQSEASAMLIALASKADEQEASFQVEHSLQQKERQQEFEKLRSDLEAVRAAYETQMQLQGPVLYWQAKYEGHRNAKWTTAAVLVVFAIAALWWLNGSFQQAAQYLPNLASNDPLPLPLLVKEGLFALVVTTVVFWIGRVLLRVYFSNQHLAIDAAERKTMVMTFLALVKDNALKDTDRAAILIPLFRSASDGIVKDDSAPDSAFAMLLSALAKPQK